MTENRTKSTQSQDEIITPEDLGFEQRLGPARVSSLSVRGSVVALEPPLVAIVGTRQPDGDGLAMARSLASACAARGITVVSGGALGIDAAAHQGALEGRGRTVVVLPSGLDKPYPLRHRAMYARLVERGGALVSMFPAETPPTRWTFPRRNELLAALCDVLVLVQAPQSSGRCSPRRSPRRSADACSSCPRRQGTVAALAASRCCAAERCSASAPTICSTRSIAVTGR
ncbi:MAG: DNA-processing protein DprA [Polyangiales bacterium]